MTAWITGGAASGKSALAEELCRSLCAGTKIYLATMAFDGSCPECRARISRHQRSREALGFRTIERCTDLAGADAPPGCCLLLECVTNLLANELFIPGGSGRNAADAIMAGIQRLSARCAHFIAVSGEVFSDGEDYAEETLFYIEALGEINRRGAALCETVIEAVCGVPVVRRGYLP